MGAVRPLGRRLALTLLLVSVTTGCAVPARMVERDVPEQQVAEFTAGKPERLREHYRVLLRQGDRNRVLNQDRIGLAALELGEFKAAGAALDDALLGIEAIYAQTETAGKARQLWYQESYKDFKGEPYERVMAYYYRGLLYLHEGDYENARASFKGGQLQDAFAEDEQSRSDFALLAFLEGWASHCSASPSLAAESFEEATRLKPELPRPLEDHNVVFIAETGLAPEKFTDDPQKSALRFRRGQGFEEAKVRIQVGELALNAIPAEDLYWQASTRGGRPVDSILKGKVQFKEVTQTAGTVATAVGAATLLAGLSHRSEAATIAGGALLALGLIAQGVSAAVRPDADVRFWDTLPDTVHVATTRVATGEKTSARFSFLDASDTVLEPQGKTVNIVFAGKCGIAWARSRSAVPSDPRAPGTTTSK